MLMALFLMGAHLLGERTTHIPTTRARSMLLALVLQQCKPDRCFSRSLYNHASACEQITAWNQAGGLLDPEQQASMLAVPGHAAALQHISAALTADASATQRARLHACAGRLTSTADSAEQAALLRTAAAGGALGKGRDWRKATDEEIVDAFASAAVAEGAVSNAGLVAAVSAATLAQCDPRRCAPPVAACSPAVTHLVGVRLPKLLRARVCRETVRDALLRVSDQIPSLQEMLGPVTSTVSGCQSLPAARRGGRQQRACRAGFQRKGSVTKHQRTRHPRYSSLRAEASGTTGGRSARQCTLQVSQLACRGIGHDGRPLSAEHIDLLRSAVLRSSSADAAAAWQALPDDAAFLTAFSTAMLSNAVTVAGETVIVPEPQRHLFQASAAAVLDAAAAAGEPAAAGVFGGPLPRLVSSAGSVGRSGSLVRGTTTRSAAAAAPVDELPRLDLSELPNTAEARQLREFAAKCEVQVQLHQTQVRVVNSSRTCSEHHLHQRPGCAGTASSARGEA